MTNLTPELNLIQGEDDDDTADYLTIDLANTLSIVDGLFNNTTGHTHSGAHQGGILGANSFADNTIPGAKLVDNSVNNIKLLDLTVTGAKIADGTITGSKLAANMLESLYAGTTVVVATNYVVAAGIMFVFCNAAITVTLPVIATNRPITVIALNGQVTITAASGGVIGGSINTSSGAIMNGICSQGDSLTYKSDTANWRVV